MSRTVVLVRAGWHDRVMPLPPDGHVHSEWSWDASNGSMEKTCSRAVEMGLPAVAFTEHADLLPASTGLSSLFACGVGALLAVRGRG
jgi:PHP domain